VFWYPSQFYVMAEARSFVAALSRAGKTFEEIKATTDAFFGDQSFYRAQIYKIMKLLKDRKRCQT